MGLMKRQYRCHECRTWCRRSEGSGWWFIPGVHWICNQCRSRMAAERRAAKRL